MTKTSFLFGYAGKRKTEAQMNQVAGWNKLHPEVRRRALALMNACPYDLGFGNGYRTTAQQEWTNENSAGTTAGNSYHEATDFLGYALALDFLNYMPAIKWAVQHAAEYGFQTGTKWVTPERWHFQLVEVPASKRNYKPNLYPIKYFNLPGETAERKYYSPFPPAPLKPGDKSDRVRQLQAQLAAWSKNPGAIDGQYGARTRAAVEAGQREASRFDPGPYDGIYGARTKAAFDAYYKAKGWGYR